jgi:hypothetical protein
MSARDVWGFSMIRSFIVGLSCVRAAYVHEVCVWFCRASRRSCQVGARCATLKACGHFVWRVLLTAALSCRPCTALLRHFGQRCLGLQRWVLLCFRSLVRQPLLCTTDICVWLWRASWRGSRYCAVVALSGECCRPLHAELLYPYRASLRHVGFRNRAVVTSSGECC